MNEVAVDAPRSWRGGAPTRVGGALVCGLLSAATAAQAEIAFQSRNDIGVGTNPTALAVPAPRRRSCWSPTTAAWPRFAMRMASSKPARARARDAARTSGDRTAGADGGAAVAYGAREAARIAVAPVDASGRIGSAEWLALPALPRAARIAMRGGGSAGGAVRRARRWREHAAAQ